MVLKVNIANKVTFKAYILVNWSIGIYLQSSVVTKFHIRSGKWVHRRDILDVLGKRRKYLLKPFTNKYLTKT